MTTGSGRMEIQQLMKRVREDHFLRPGRVTDHSQPVIYWEETSFGGEPFDVPLVILRTAPCRWFRSGGCVMCNYELMAIDEGVPDASLLIQLKNAHKCLGDFGKFKYLFLTSQGSFFDDHEVSQSARRDIAYYLREAGLRSMATESEAKYCIAPDRVEEFIERSSLKLSIGIGLEAYDPFIRNHVLNKGLEGELLLKAAASIQGAGANFYTYITLGKPFLTIEEDIADAISAVELSLELGGVMCVLEMVNLQPYTLTFELNQIGRYRPPSLWTGIACLLRLSEHVRGRVSLKGVEADTEPTPKEVASSCQLCQHRLLRAIRDWNYYRQVSSLNEVWKCCPCFDAWALEAGRRDVEEIGERLRSGLRAVSDSLDSRRRRDLQSVT